MCSHYNPMPHVHRINNGVTTCHPMFSELVAFQFAIVSTVATTNSKLQSIVAKTIANHSFTVLAKMRFGIDRLSGRTLDC